MIEFLGLETRDLFGLALSGGMALVFLAINIAVIAFWGRLK